MNHIIRALLLVALVAVGLNASATEPQKDLSGDYLLFQGRWVVMRNEIKKQTTPDMHGRLFIFEGRTFRLDTDKGSEGYSINESTVPKSIDFDDGRLPVVRGIYRLEGDKLVICTAAPGDKRPMEFKTSVDTETILTELKRKNEGAQPKERPNR